MATIKNEYWECETVGEPMRAGELAVGTYFVDQGYYLFQIIESSKNGKVTYRKVCSNEGNYDLHGDYLVQPVSCVVFLQKKESEPMPVYNQLRQNVRNYAVGLTCEEIERELVLCRDNPNTVERAKYFAEYLEELEKEQNREEFQDIKVGNTFCKKQNHPQVFIKTDEGCGCVILPECDRGVVYKFYENAKVYRVTDVEITRKER